MFYSGRNSPERRAASQGALTHQLLDETRLPLISLGEMTTSSIEKPAMLVCVQTAREVLGERPNICKAI